jgi:hypothetical protein
MTQYGGLIFIEFFFCCFSSLPDILSYLRDRLFYFCNNLSSLRNSFVFVKKT